MAAANSDSYIKVCVRIRPLSQSEFNHDALSSEATRNRRESTIQTMPRKTLAVLDKQVLIFDPSDANNEFVKGVPTHNNKRTRDLQYAFDRVFPETSGQRDVYVNAVQHLLDGVMDGINATVFAYGATGAGKTYTISGTKEDPGIMPLCMLELFEKIKNSEKQNLVDVTVSYLEVYNETIRDLLCPDSGVLDLREDSNNQVVVAGLSEHQPKSCHDIMELLDIGTMNRTQNSTKANEASSRSHGIFQINIQQRDRNTGIHTSVKTATLTLCDLAGSERASVTDNRGQLLREGANINKSLLALGNCINALCDSKKSLQHIPFRDSKLTRLLKYSLGGNCRTVMIANISPAICHYEETHNTLKYAWRAKKIKLNVQKNAIDVQYHVGQYAELISSLQNEVSQLRMQLDTDKKKDLTYTFNPQLPGNLSVVSLMNYMSFVNEQFQSLSKKENENDWNQIFESTNKFLGKQESIKEKHFVDQSKQFLKCLMQMDLTDSQKQQILMMQLQSIVTIFGATFIDTKPNTEQVNPSFLFSPRKPVPITESKENQKESVNLFQSNHNDEGTEKKVKIPRRRSFLPVPVATLQTTRPNPIFGSARKPMTRRTSTLPKAESSLPPIFKPIKYNFTQIKNGDPVEQPGRDINDDLHDIDSFLDENSTPKANRTIKTSSNEIDDEPTPNAQSLANRYNLRSYQSYNDDQPLLKTPRQLRSFVAANVINSPHIGAMPFSPARPSRRIR